MASLLHETLVELVERAPSLLGHLVGPRLRVLARKRLGYATDHTRVSQLREVDADLVLKVFSSRGTLVRAIVFEVQLAKDVRKTRSWPLYAAWVHQRLRCPVHVVILTVDPKVAAWAAGPFCSGDVTLHPWVIGPEHIPSITDPAVAREAVELALLSGLAHAQEPVAIEIGRALWHALDATHHVYADQYWDIFMGRLDTAIRRALEMELQGWKPQSPWGKRIYAKGLAKGEAKGRRLGKAEGLAKGLAKGLAEGLAEGEALGEARSVLALLRMRGIRVTRAQRQEILDCHDLRRLRAWLRLAYTASTAAALFEPCRRAG